MEYAVERIIGIITAIGTLIVALGNWGKELIESWETNDLDKLFLTKPKRITLYCWNIVGLFVSNVVFISLLAFGIYIFLGPSRNYINEVATGVINFIAGMILIFFIFKNTMYLKKIIKVIDNFSDNIIIVTWVILAVSISIFVVYSMNFSDLFWSNAIASTINVIIYSAFLIILLELMKKIFAYDNNKAKYYFYSDGKKYYLYYTQVDGVMVYGEEDSYEANKEFKFVSIDQLRTKYTIHRV